MDSNQSNYVYNCTKIYKNNYPINVDVDSICDELYNIAGNRASFEDIMKRVENDVLNSDDVKKAKKDEKKLKQNTFYSTNNLYNGNKFIFKSTVPEGELIKEPIYQSSILHKKYTDVNANSKYYFPQKDQTIMGEQINFKTQWTNRANKILLDSQNINFNKIMNPNNDNIFQNFGYNTSPITQDINSKLNNPIQ